MIPVAAHPVPGLRECPGCGTVCRLPTLPPRADARCPRCDTVLRRARRVPLDVPLALTLTALVLYAVTVTAPFLSLRLLGRLRVSTIETGPATLATTGLWLVGVAVLATAVLLPLARMAVTLTVLLGLRRATAPRWLYVPFRWYERLAPWSMLEVFLFGALVAYTRLVALATVDVGVAAYALASLCLVLIAADCALDPVAVWEALQRRGATATPMTTLTATAATAPAPAARPIGCPCCHLVSSALPDAPCPRCATPLRPRKPDSVARTWALIAGAAVLYIPANALPVMLITTFGRGGPHTILGGARELLENGMWPLALLVFAASVMVPVLKISGLVLMLLATARGSATALRDRTRLYRVVDAIGRWSMIDVFTVSVLVALVRFGSLADIEAGLGGLCFAGVVVLTMLAAGSFDPRLMWDAADRARR